MAQIWTSCLLMVALYVIKLSNCKNWCGGKENETHIVDPYGTATANFCVAAGGRIDDVITINKRSIDLNKTKTSYHYDIRVKEDKNARQCYTIRVTNMTVGKVENYTVNVTSGGVSVCVYKFKVSFKKESLRPCLGEDMNKTVTVSNNVTAVFHLCVISDHGRVDHIGINETVYVINGDNSSSKPYKVREITVASRDRKIQFLQITVPSVLNVTCVSYHLMFSPASELRIESRVLSHVSIDFPSTCSSQQYYTYFLAEVNERKELQFCFEHSSQLQNVSLVTYNSHTNDLSKHRINSLTVNKQHQINLTVPHVKETDFGRYEMRLIFDGNLYWNVTFYLLKQTELPGELCVNGTIAKTVLSDINGAASFCVQDYGVVFKNDTIVINGDDHVVGDTQNNINSSLSVSGHWDRSLQMSYLQIHIHQLQMNESTKRYDVSIPHLDTTFTFEIILNAKTELDNHMNISEQTTFENESSTTKAYIETTIENESSTTKVFERHGQEGFDLGGIVAIASAGFLIIFTIFIGLVAVRLRKLKCTKEQPPSSYPDSFQTQTSSERNSDTPSSSNHIYERISDLIYSFIRSSSSGSSRSWSSVVTDYRRKVVLSEVVYAEYSLPDGSSWDSYSQRVESDGSGTTLRNSYHVNCLRSVSGSAF